MSHKKKEFIALSAILLLALGLRLYHLGFHSFWLDETGVAIAAVSSTLKSAIEIARSHAAAMPLDYVVAWLFARVSLADAWLRLPSALWGTASVLVAYLLFKKYVDAFTALVGVFFLALSPMLLSYSQELRFYSALVFFSLCSAWLLIHAFQRSSRSAWLWAGAITLIGAYFHIFVCLAFLPAFLWWLFSPRETLSGSIPLRRFLITAAITALLVLPGYLFFCASDQYQDHILWQTLPIELLRGFGFTPFQYHLSAWVFGLLLMLLTLGGIGMALVSRHKPLTSLCLAFILQAALIIASVALSHYFLAGRQFLALLPFTCLFAAYEITLPLSLAKNAAALNRPAQWIPKITVALLLSLVTLSAIPALSCYYDFENSRGLALSQQLIQRWKPGDCIWVVPTPDHLVYQYYLSYRLGHPQLAGQVEGKTYAEALAGTRSDCTTYLLVPSVADSQIKAGLARIGYRPDPQWGTPKDDVDILLVRP